MRIVIDMQPVQAESGADGIDTFALGLIQALLRNAGGHEFFLALSDLYPETVDPIRFAFRDTLPATNIRVWQVPLPLCSPRNGSQTGRRIAELLREAFLASLQPDVIHVLSSEQEPSQHRSLEDVATALLSSWESTDTEKGSGQRYLERSTAMEKLLNALAAEVDTTESDNHALVRLSSCVARNMAAGIERQLLLDASEIVEPESGAPAFRQEAEEARGLRRILKSPPPGFRVEPVRALPQGGYVYARRLALELLGMSQASVVDDAPMQWQRGDVFACLARPGSLQEENRRLYAQMAQEGVTLSGVKDTRGSRSAGDSLWQVLLQSTDIIQTFQRWHEDHASPRQLLVDISEVAVGDHKTGIQRVVRSILLQWLYNPPRGWSVEPVYASERRGYRYARHFTRAFLNQEPDESLTDAPVDFAPGDIFVGLDLQCQIVPAQRAFFREFRRSGVRVLFVVYDLLCVTYPEYFLVDKYDFLKWLEVVCENDGAMCISRTVAEELAAWHKAKGAQRMSSLYIDWFHLGMDIANSAPSMGLPPEAGETLHKLRSRPSFLMVGTLEPRKGHAQVLEAFERLWNKGRDINLVIVGKKGWLMEDALERLGAHPEMGCRIIWLNSISDEYLERIYASCSCLVAASYGEGFGLPLIEAAQHSLPVVARDIPVFREVAGDKAFYFVADTGRQLADALQEWLELNAKGETPRSEGMSFWTWKQSATRLLELCMHGEGENSHQMSEANL